MIHQESPMAPDFILQGHDGLNHRLSDHLGQRVILYFYPKDNTPGCTQQACNFRDHFEQFSHHNCVIYGVSKDSVDSHYLFHDTHQLNFTLLSDPDLFVHKSYGAVIEGIVKRTTILINDEGKITRKWLNVNIEQHAESILTALEE